MFRGPSFIVSTMQEETTPIFKHLWYDWTQQQPGIEPTNPLGQCWVPPIVAFYDQQGLLRTYSLPGSSIRSPHPGSPRGVIQEKYSFNIKVCMHAYQKEPQPQALEDEMRMEMCPISLNRAIGKIVPIKMD